MIRDFSEEKKKEFKLPVYFWRVENIDLKLNIQGKHEIK